LSYTVKYESPSENARGIQSRGILEHILQKAWQEGVRMVKILSYTNDFLNIFFITCSLFYLASGMVNIQNYTRYS